MENVGPAQRQTRRRRGHATGVRGAPREQRVFVHRLGEIDAEIDGLAEELFGAEVVDPFYSQTIAYRGRPVSFAGAAFDVVRRHGSVPFPGRDSSAVFERAWSEGAAVVNEPFSTRFGVGEGDSVRLDLPGGTLEREVAGVFRDYSRSHGLVVVDRADFLRFFPGRGPDDMALFLPPDADVQAARSRFMEVVRGRFLVEVLDNRELRAAVLSAFERTFAITTAMYLVTAVVAVVSVFSVLLTLVGERRRELATVRAVGGSRWQLLAMVVHDDEFAVEAARKVGVAESTLVRWLEEKLIAPSVVADGDRDLWKVRFDGEERKRLTHGNQRPGQLHWNEEAGQVWLARAFEHWPAHLWINPVPERHWGHTHSIRMISEIFDRYDEMAFGLDLAEFTDFATAQFESRFKRIERASSR